MRERGEVPDRAQYSKYKSEEHDHIAEVASATGAQGNEQDERARWKGIGCARSGVPNHKLLVNRTETNNCKTSSWNVCSQCWPDENGSGDEKRSAANVRADSLGSMRPLKDQFVVCQWNTRWLRWKARRRRSGEARFKRASTDQKIFEELVWKPSIKH